MGSRREQLTERLAHLSPTQVERDEVGIVMCELLADLLDALNPVEQVRPEETTPPTELAAEPDLVPDVEHQDEPDTGQDTQEATVRLTEPELPPVDPEPAPARLTQPSKTTEPGPAAGDDTGAGRSRTPPAKKTGTAKNRRTGR